jgi:hypothetical protein
LYDNSWMDLGTTHIMSHICHLSEGITARRANMCEVFSSSLVILHFNSSFGGCSATSIPKGISLIFGPMGNASHLVFGQLVSYMGLSLVTRTNPPIVYIFLGKKKFTWTSPKSCSECTCLYPKGSISHFFCQVFPNRPLAATWTSHVRYS